MKATILGEMPLRRDCRWQAHLVSSGNLKRDGTAFAIPSTNLLHVPTWEITKPEGTVVYVYADKPEPMDDGGVRFTTEQNGSRVVVDEFDADGWSSYMQSGTP